MGIAQLTLQEANRAMRLLKEPHSLEEHEVKDMTTYLLSVPDLIDDALKERHEGCMSIRQSHIIIGNVWKSVEQIKSDIRNSTAKPFQQYINKIINKGIK